MSIRQVITIKLIGLFLFLLIITGCQNIENRWKKTQAINTIEAYKDFLERHSQSLYADSANFKLEKLRFEQTLTRNTIEAYQGFLNLYPQSQYSDSIRSKLLDIRYNEAKVTNTVEAYENFIQQYPHSIQAVDAGEKIRFLKAPPYSIEISLPEGGKEIDIANIEVFATVNRKKIPSLHLIYNRNRESNKQEVASTGVITSDISNYLIDGKNNVNLSIKLHKFEPTEYKFPEGRAGFNWETGTHEALGFTTKCLEIKLLKKITEIKSKTIDIQFINIGPFITLSMKTENFNFVFEKNE